MKKQKSIDKKVVNIIILIMTISVVLLAIIIAKPFSKAEESAIFFGSGTEKDPFLIESAKDLVTLANAINNNKSYGGNYYNDKYYKLVDDIDFKGVDNLEIIGRMKERVSSTEMNKYAFKGNFNGNGHVIKNVTYTISEVSARERIGLFGEIYGDGENNGSVYNLTIDNMNIVLDSKSTGSYNAVTIGTIVGHLGQNASIKNCIVKNSLITVTSKYSIIDRSKLQIGGIVGETSKNITDDGWTAFDTTTGGYGIENCYANVNITVNDDNWKDESLSSTANQGLYCRYGIGGIVGGFCNVNKFPENCIYQGTITTTKGFASPSFGMGEFDTLTPTNYSKLYVALNSKATSSENTNYYYNTKIVNNALETKEYELTDNYKEEHKKLITDSKNIYIYPLKTDATSVVGAVQGVNRGDYIDSLSSKLTMLNTYASTDSKYDEWLYDEKNNEFYFETPQPIEGFSGGIGTEKNPYLITTVKDIQELATYVNSNAITQNGGYYKNKYYKLMNNIDFSGIEFVPIGYSPNSNYLEDCTIKYSFQGNFNGNGYSLKNITYNISSNANVDGVSYGLFGMLWGNGNNNGSVYNLVIDNMKINLEISGSNYKDIRVGIIAGHLGKNSSIKNCIVNNSKITCNINDIASGKKLAIGGIVGETGGNASKDESSWSVFDTTTGGYGIENCYSNVNIISNDSNLGTDSSGQKFRRYAIGGIVGSFCNVNKFPENCIYSGKIQTDKAIAGTIYGYGEFTDGVTWSYFNAFGAYGSTDSKEDSNYYHNTTFVNNSLSPKSYTIDNSYLNSERGISVGEKIVYPLTNDSTSMGYVQGVNSGNLNENLKDLLQQMNSYNGIGTKYKTWYYNSVSDILSFSKTVNIAIQRSEYNFKLLIENIPYDESFLEYEWYIDGIKQEGIGNNITLNPMLDSDRELTCKVYYKDTYIGTDSIIIEKETIKLDLNKKIENNKELVFVNFEKLGIFEITDFNFQWYYKDEGEIEYNKIFGETSYQYEISKDSIGKEFKVIITLNKYDISYSQELSYKYNTVIYVDQTNGNDSNDGLTDTMPVNSLEKAYSLLAEDSDAKSNIIVIMGEYTNIVTTYPKEKNDKFIKPATICGKYLGNDYSGSIQIDNNIFFNADIIWDDILIKSWNSIFMYAQENDLTLGENVEFNSGLNLIKNDTQAKYWGLLDIENYTQLKKITIVGGTLNYKTSTHNEIKTKTSNITVKCSGVAVITAGSRTQGDLGAEVYGTIDKHANVKITVDIPNSTSNIDVGLVVGGQCDSSCYINSEININNGKIGKVIGGTLGYGNAYTKDIPRDTFYGSTKININGGKIVDVFGGPLGRNQPTSYMYGQVEINVNGGNITNIYGAGSGGTIGYSSFSTDTYKDHKKYGVVGKTMTRTNSDGQEETYKLDESQVVINITGGTIEDSVYGGGYGKFQNCESNPEMADDGGTLYGNTILNITGGIIKGSVYGGAKGIENEYTTSKPNIAQIYGNVTVNISGDVSIRGFVYGGSEGLAQYANMSKITGNVKVNIDGNNVKIADGNNIYGGGKAGKIDGTISLKINNVELKNNIYGAGDGENATVENSIVSKSNDIVEVENKVVDLKITNSVINGTVFGGGNSADVYGSILVYVTDKSNITNAIYGGCNNANVGEEDNPQNTYVYVSNAIIGTEENNKVLGGEVFGGGNIGLVYGNTTIEIGDEDSKIQTKVGGQVYAGGKGVKSQANSNDVSITVKGDSIGKIIGTNTEITQYGSSELGAVEGIVDIFFEKYLKTSGTNKYKTMTGINKATNIYLTDSYVYLTGGLANIQNLFIPQNTGMMISDNSILEGDLIGGGYIDIQSGAKLIIEGNLKNSTTLTLSPKQDEEGSFQTVGGDNNPYVVVLGTDESNGSGMISGESEKYTILNNPKKEYTIDGNIQKTSIYYIAETVTANKGITEKINNIEDKVFTSEINNTEEVYILKNGSFSSQLKVEYSMIRRKNSNDEWEFTDDMSMKNIRRYIYLSSNNASTKLPKGTKITMIINGKYYSYNIPENFGTDEYWNNISKELGVTENLEYQIPLYMFKDSNGNNYLETTNLQDKMNLNIEQISNILTYQESFRFIFDFSSCSDFPTEGSNEIILNLMDYREDSIKDNVYIEYEQNNIIKIEDRNYKIETTLKHESENQIVPFDFKIRFSADEISKVNKSEQNKQLKIRISLLNENLEKIKLPKGTIIIIDGNKNDITNDEIVYTLIDSLQTTSYDKTINLQIDMSNVSDGDLIGNGKYNLRIDAYLAENDILLGNNSIISSKTEFEFKKADGYGIKVSTTDTQLITKLEESRTINITAQIGTLENGAYINIKTLRRQDEFKYVEVVDTTSAESQQVALANTTSSLMPFSVVIFKDEGIYRYVYQLCDKYGNVITEDFINFIVMVSE